MEIQQYFYINSNFADGNPTIIFRMLRPTHLQHFRLSKTRSRDLLMQVSYYGVSDMSPSRIFFSGKEKKKTKKRKQKPNKHKTKNQALRERGARTRGRVRAQPPCRKLVYQK